MSLAEEHLSGELRADAAPKHGLPATAMRIEISAKDNMHNFVDSFPERVYTYIDKVGRLGGRTPRPTARMAARRTDRPPDARQPVPTCTCRDRPAVKGEVPLLLQPPPEDREHNFLEVFGPLPRTARQALW